jgi:hypothetical protein
MWPHPLLGQAHTTRGSGVRRRPTVRIRPQKNRVRREARPGAADGRPCGGAGPPPSVAASPRVDPANGENLRPRDPQPTVCHAPQFSSSNAAGGDGKIRGEERADAHTQGSRGWPPPPTTETLSARASRRSVSQLEEAINPLRVPRPVGPARRGVQVGQVKRSARGQTRTSPSLFERRQRERPPTSVDHLASGRHALDAVRGRSRLTGS